MINAKTCIGTHDVVILTFDTLRFDVAERGLVENRTPYLKSLLPDGQWEKRHTPATFTYPAHHAFFTGYLPTPIPKTDTYSRIFACEFAGSTSTGDTSWVTDKANIIQGLQAVGYHTLCIGGVGFFNKQNDLGRVLPAMFKESHWSPALGVTDPHSTQNQVSLAIQRMQQLDPQQCLLLFINLSATHQPNCIFSDGATVDSPDTQLDALTYIDSKLPALFEALQSRGRNLQSGRDTLCILSSDHGTTYGEDDTIGHGIAHPNIWDVPYAEFILKGTHD